LGLKCFNSTIYGVKTTESLFRLNAATAVEFSYWKLWYPVMSESTTPLPTERCVSKLFMAFENRPKRKKRRKLIKNRSGFSALDIKKINH